ncbi:MAG: LytTR family DNA-binding domain-containing protein [Pseudomonadales bacterium]
MDKSLTAVVADDENHLRDYLCKQLGVVWPELEVVGLASNGREALSQIETLAPDVAFLDIKMPVMTGLEVAAAMTASTRVVFVTAFDEFAVAAFERAAVDYLLKPVDEVRLKRTVDRLTAQPAVAGDLDALLASLQGIRGVEIAYLGWVRVGNQGETRIIPVDEVVYFKADQKYTSVRTHEAEYLIRKSIKELEGRLDPDKFWRVHRSTLVNVRFIDVAKRDFRGRFTLQLKGLDQRLKVSDTYSHRFRQM